MNLTRPHVDYDVDAGTWLLLEDWSGRINGWSGEIPAGFRYDLSSIPRLLWPLIGPHELSVVAPLIHDWLYRTQTVTRRNADRVFRLTMRDQGVGPCRRKAAWLAVRVFGWAAWRKHR